MPYMTASGFAPTVLSMSQDTFTLFADVYTATSTTSPYSVCKGAKVISSELDPSITYAFVINNSPYLTNKSHCPWTDHLLNIVCSIIANHGMYLELYYYSNSCHATITNHIGCHQCLGYNQLLHQVHTMFQEECTNLCIPRTSCCHPKM